MILPLNLVCLNHHEIKISKQLVNGLNLARAALDKAAQGSLIDTAVRGNPILGLAACFYHVSKHFSYHIIN